MAIRRKDLIGSKVKQDGSEFYLYAEKNPALKNWTVRTSRFDPRTPSIFGTTLSFGTFKTKTRAQKRISELVRKDKLKKVM